MDIDAIESDLLEYADFEEVGSVTRARLFVTAAKRWLILRPESASNQGSSLSMSKSVIVDLLKRAQNFVSANASGNNGRVRFLSAENYRG